MNSSSPLHFDGELMVDWTLFQYYVHFYEQKKRVIKSKLFLNWLRNNNCHLHATSRSSHNNNSTDMCSKWFSWLFLFFHFSFFLILSLPYYFANSFARFRVWIVFAFFWRAYSINLCVWTNEHFVFHQKQPIKFLK